MRESELSPYEVERCIELERLAKIARSGLPIALSEARRRRQNAIYQDVTQQVGRYGWAGVDVITSDNP